MNCLSHLIKGLNKYGQPGNESVTSSWDELQQEFECCGVKSYTDWQNTTFQNGNMTNAPDSCCWNEKEGCGMNQLTANGTIYHEGCFSVFEEFIQDNAYIVGGVGAGLGSFQILAFIFACCAARKMKNDDDGYY